ncbi:Chaperone protein dnaJ 2, partial [Durusdinium trenchii]
MAIELEVYALSERLCKVSCDAAWTGRQLKEAIEEATDYRELIGSQHLAIGTRFLTDDEVIGDLESAPCITLTRRPGLSKLLQPLEELPESVTAKSVALALRQFDRSPLIVWIITKGFIFDCNPEGSDGWNATDTVVHEIMGELAQKYGDDADEEGPVLEHKHLSFEMLEDFVPWKSLCDITQADIAMVLALQASYMWIGDGQSAVGALLLLKDGRYLCLCAHIGEAVGSCEYDSFVGSYTKTADSLEELRALVPADFWEALQMPISAWRSPPKTSLGTALPPGGVNLRLAFRSLPPNFAVGGALKKYEINHHAWQGFEGDWFCPTRKLSHRIIFDSNALGPGRTQPFYTALEHTAVLSHCWRSAVRSAVEERKAGGSFVEAMSVFQENLARFLDEQKYMSRSMSKNEAELPFMEEIWARGDAVIEQLLGMLDSLDEEPQEPMDRTLLRLLGDWMEREEQQIPFYSRVLMDGALVVYTDQWNKEFLKSTASGVPEEGEMLADAVGRWLGQSGMSPLIYEDSEPWPENRPCAATDAQPDSKKHARSRSHSKTHTDSQPDGQQKATWPAGVVLVVLAVGVLLAAGVGAALAIRRQRRRPGEGAGVALAGAERTFEYELQDAGAATPAQWTGAQSCERWADPFNFGNLFLVVTLLFPEEPESKRNSDNGPESRRLEEQMWNNMEDPIPMPISDAGDGDCAPSADAGGGGRGMAKSGGVASCSAWVMLSSKIGSPQLSQRLRCQDLEEVFCEDLDPLQSAKASKKVITTPEHRQAYDEDDERGPWETHGAAWSGVQAAVKGGDALPCAPCESGGFAPGKNNENTAMIMVSLVLAGSSLVDLALRIEEFPSPLVRGDVLEGTSRAKVMKWSFRVTREEIKDRLDLLDQSFYDYDFRDAVYLRREEDADEDTLLERLLQYYVSSGIKSWGQSTHPDNLDFWLAQEGGVARTCEMLLALEVLNFYRWICRLSRFQVDSFLQELADLFIQAIQKRSDRPLCKATEDHLGLISAIEDFVAGESGRLAIVTHVPGACDAARQLFYGLPSTTTSDGGPQVLSGTTDVSLPVKGEVCLEPYLPLFRLADPGEVARRASKPTELAEEDQKHRYAEGIRTMPVPDGPPASLPTPPGAPRFAGEGFSFTMDRWWRGLSSRGRSRKSPCWGDLRGVCSFRRSLLDPRVYSIGLLRRGCNFCVLCPADIFDGQPPEDIHEEPAPEDDFLDPDLETNDKEVEAEVKATIGKEYRALLKWREAEPWKKMVKTRTKKNVGNFHMHEKLTSLDEAVDFDDMAGWPVLRGTFMEKDLQHDPILFARRAQDSMDAQMRTEHALRLEGKLVESNTAKKRFEHFVEEDELMEPIMVCFPPPGIVPIEMVCEAEMMPWTISPDPYRLS